MHKKCTGLRIFEADAKICIILYACKIITNLLNRSIQKYLEFQGKRGCVISLDNSWRITVDQRMHISCCACAYQLLCKRTTAVVRPKILTVSTTYPISSSNLSYLFQQLILSLPATDSISFNNMTYIYQQQEGGCVINQ